MNAKRPTRIAIALDYRLWREFFDTDPVMTEEEFCCAAIQTRLTLLEEAFGPDPEEREWRVIFDNGGGITLQLGEKWAHHYQDAADAVRDLKAYLEGQDGDTSHWEGHEEEALELDPTDEQIRNGGYRVASSWEELAGLGHPETGWGANSIQFMEALRA